MIHLSCYKQFNFILETCVYIITINNHLRNYKWKLIKIIITLEFCLNKERDQMRW